MSKQFLFLALISLMLFVLAIAGQDRSPLARKLTDGPVSSASRALQNVENASAGEIGRSPASEPRKLDIEPIPPGGE